MALIISTHTTEANMTNTENLRKMQTAATTVITPVVRLTPEVYAELEKRHTRLSVSATSTPIEVAFQLGVQSVLRDLRAGYVVQA